MGNTEPSEHDDLDDFFASDSLERSSTVKAVTKSHKTKTAVSTNDRTAELAKLPTKRPRRSNSPSQGVRSVGCCFLQRRNARVRAHRRRSRRSARPTPRHRLVPQCARRGRSGQARGGPGQHAQARMRAHPHPPNGRRHLLMNEFGISADHITQAERMLAEQRRTNELAASASEASERKKKERSGSASSLSLKRARRKIGKRLSLDRAADIGSSLVAMSSPFSSVHASAR